MKLGKFIEKLDALVKARDEIKRRISIEARILIQDSFRQETSPVQVPWAPIQRKGPILQKTGRVRNSFDVNPSELGIVIRNSTDYAQYQQYGTRSIQARTMIPDKSPGCGPVGLTILREPLNEVIQRQ